MAERMCICMCICAYVRVCSSGEKTPRGTRNRDEKELRKMESKVHVFMTSLQNKHAVRSVDNAT